MLPMSSCNVFLLRNKQNNDFKLLISGFGPPMAMLFVTGTGKICIKETGLPNKKIVIT